MVRNAMMSFAGRQKLRSYFVVLFLVPKIVVLGIMK